MLRWSRVAGGSASSRPGPRSRGAERLRWRFRVQGAQPVDQVRTSRCPTAPAARSSRGMLLPTVSEPRPLRRCGTSVSHDLALGVAQRLVGRTTPCWTRYELPDHRGALPQQAHEMGNDDGIAVHGGTFPERAQDSAARFTSECTSVEKGSLWPPASAPVALPADRPDVWPGLRCATQRAPPTYRYFVDLGDWQASLLAWGPASLAPAWGAVSGSTRGRSSLYWLPGPDSTKYRY
jgi:hypothetical protein